jgi:hypothetical protein|tara:strand:+ start:1328 stop:2233 length:906 start_codon:yes stop_codon:yes gene_type:complete
MSSNNLNNELQNLKIKIKSLSKCSEEPLTLEKTLSDIYLIVDNCLNFNKNDIGLAILPLINFRDCVKLDLDNSKKFVKQFEKKLKLDEEFQIQRDKFRNLEIKTSEVCGKYFDRQQEYTMTSSKEMAEIESKFSNLNEEFFDKADNISKGYIVSINGEECNLKDIFQFIFDKKIETVKLKKKFQKNSLLRQADENDAGNIKEEVFSYLIEETAGKIHHMLKNKQEFIARDKYTSSDIKVLELACQEAEKQRGKCEKNIGKLRVEILGIQMSKAFNYQNKAKIEEIKNVYNSKVQEIANKIV